MLCQVGWGASLHSYFQVSPEMLDRVQVQALAAPLKDIQRLVPKPLLRCLGCVLRVVVLLEGEPLIFIKDLSILCSVKLSLNPDYPPSPCRMYIDSDWSDQSLTNVEQTLPLEIPGTVASHLANIR